MARKKAPVKSSVPVLTAVQRIILYVRDTERSARWYTETLGIPVRVKDPGWVELGTEGVTLCLHGGRSRAAVEDQPAIGFRVKDFDAAHKALQLREVPGLGEPFSPCEGVRCLSFRDPDGNQLGIEGR
ncbi:MAG TPA: VOC family protein [Planctomycetota bacterium]|nr:VOC family protein [Planctomycetota bacterium]